MKKQIYRKIGLPLVGVAAVVGAFYLNLKDLGNNCIEKEGVMPSNEYTQQKSASILTNKNSIMVMYRERLYHPEERGIAPSNTIEGLDKKVAESAVIAWADFVNRSIRILRDERDNPIPINESQVRYAVRKTDGGVRGSAQIKDGDWGRMFSFVDGCFESYRDDRFAKQRFEPKSSYNDPDINPLILLETLRGEKSYSDFASAERMVKDALINLGAPANRISKLGVIREQERDRNGFLPIYTIYLIPEGGRDRMNFAARGSVAGCVAPKGIISYLECDLNQLALPLPSLDGIR